MKAIIKNAVECINANLNGIETEGRSMKDCKAAFSKLSEELAPIKYMNRSEATALPLDSLNEAIAAKTLKHFIQLANAASEDLDKLKARKQAPVVPDLTQQAPVEHQAPELSALPPVLVAIADNMDKLTELHNPPAIIKTEAKMISNPPRTLPELAVEIKMYMERAASAALRVGGLLVLARDFHASQDAFLQWADETVGIKKAQAYKLIKVHMEFGEDARFNGVAMRVLDMLAGKPAEVIKKAAELAEAGKLDSKAAEVLTGKVIDITPIKIQLSAPPAEVIIDTQYEDAHLAPESDCPFDTGVTINPPAQAPSASAQNAPADVVELEHTVEMLNARIAELSKPLPALLQFKATNMAIRLGLSPKGCKSKSEVRAAYRVLASIWNKDKSPESYKLITEALDTLLEDMK